MAAMHGEERIRQIDETAGKQTRDIEEDNFFGAEDAEEAPIAKREVDKRGNVI